MKCNIIIIIAKTLNTVQHYFKIENTTVTYLCEFSHFVNVIILCVVCVCIWYANVPRILVYILAINQCINENKSHSIWIFLHKFTVFGWKRYRKPISLVVLTSLFAQRMTMYIYDMSLCTSWHKTAHITHLHTHTHAVMHRTIASLADTVYLHNMEQKSYTENDLLLYAQHSIGVCIS